MLRRGHPRSIAALLLVALLAASPLASQAIAQEGEEQPEASVRFPDQATDGTRVEVASVSMSEGGFVAIHDQRLYTGPVDQSVAGVSDKLAPGTHENVTVELSPALETTQTLIAMPHLDTDGNDRFEYFETNREEDGAYQDGAVTDEAEVEVEASSPAPAAWLVGLTLAGLAAARARSSP